MKFVYIADFYYPNILGGGEQNDFELLKILEARGHEIVRLKSEAVGVLDIVNHCAEYKFIVSNFIMLPQLVKKAIQETCDFVVWEHDHKYLITRDPSCYDDYIAPPEDLVNEEFYRSAKAVFVQSKLHEEILTKNLMGLGNVVRVGGNIWPEETLVLLEELSQSPPRREVASIMVSNIWHKNTAGAIKYCEWQNISYELIAPSSPMDFLKALSRNDVLIFLPETPETLSRIIVEARMMGCKVLTNNKVGAASEDWFSLKGLELIEVMRNKRHEVPNMLEEVFE